MVHKNIHILVVEDDPQVLKLLVGYWLERVFSVVSVDSGTAAVKVLQNQPIDLLVLDLSMPEPDSFDLLKALRVTRPDLKILVVSGYMQGALLKASEILGATASLPKVEAPKSLLKTVVAMLQQ